MQRLSSDTLYEGEMIRALEEGEEDTDRRISRTTTTTTSTWLAFFAGFSCSIVLLVLSGGVVVGHRVSAEIAPWLFLAVALCTLTLVVTSIVERSEAEATARSN